VLGTSAHPGGSPASRVAPRVLPLAESATPSALALAKASFGGAGAAGVLVPGGVAVGLAGAAVAVAGAGLAGAAVAVAGAGLAGAVGAGVPVAVPVAVGVAVGGGAVATGVGVGLGVGAHVAAAPAGPGLAVGLGVTLPGASGAHSPGRAVAPPGGPTAATSTAKLERTERAAASASEIRRCFRFLNARPPMHVRRPE
jgi:hypothetical protein